MTLSKCPLAVLKIVIHLLHIPKVNVLKVQYVPINKEQFHKELFWLMTHLWSVNSLLKCALIMKWTSHVLFDLFKAGTDRNIAIYKFISIPILFLSPPPCSIYTQYMCLKYELAFGATMRALNMVSTIQSLFCCQIAHRPMALHTNNLFLTSILYNKCIDSFSSFCLNFTS